MNKKTVKIAKQEAVRFLEKLREWEKADPNIGIHNRFTWMTPKENGSLKRSSMDLTRALAAMRKPG